MQCSFKYDAQVRLCLGVAMVKNADGSLIGIRLPLFGYSGKVLVSWKNWNKLIREEIKLVRDMKCEYSFGRQMHVQIFMSTTT